MNVRLLSAGLFRRFVCVVLAFVMATAPSAAALAQTNAAQQAVRQRVQGLGDAEPQQEPLQRAPGDRTLLADELAGKIDTTYVAGGAVAVIVLRPAQIMAAPMAEMLPTEVASAAGLKYLGFDPADMDEVVAFMGQINPMAPPEYGMTIKFNKPIQAKDIRPEIRAHAQLGELAGKKYLQSQQPMLPSFYGVDRQTLVVATDGTLQQLIAGQSSKTGPIVDRVRNVPAGNDLYVAVDVASLRPLIQMSLAQAQSKIPPDAQQFLEAPNLISAAELTFNLSGTSPVSLIVHANDEGAAQQLDTMIQTAMTRYQEKMKAQFAQQAVSEDPIEQALAKYMERMSGRWGEPLLPQRNGATLTFFQQDDADAAQQQQFASIAVIGILVALLLPAVQAAREAARRTQSMNNIKNLMLAMLTHESAKKAYPAHAIYSADGQPLLSWRVAILPFIEQQALYDQFHLDEPWDSEHNRSLIARMPQQFQNPNLPLEPGKTNYLAVVGEPCIVNGTAEGTKISRVTDGTSNTVMLVEANPDQAVEWTKPDDWEFDANNPAAGLGGVRSGVWIAGFADGSLQLISNNIDQEQLKAMFTRAGNEAVHRDAIRPGGDPPGAIAVPPRN